MTHDSARRSGELGKRRGGSHFVYLFSLGDQMTKIGRSRNPSRRLQQLKTGAPGQLVASHVWRLPNIATASSLERRLLQLFAWCAPSGEWRCASAVEIQSVGDVWLRDGDDAACHLAALIRDSHDLDESLADTRAQLAGTRDQGKREYLSALVEDILVEQIANRVSAIQNGLIPNEWDEVLTQTAA